MTYDPRTFTPEVTALVAANDRVPEQRAGEDVREVTFTFMHDLGPDADDAFVEALWETAERLGGYDQAAVSGPERPTP